LPSPVGAHVATDSARHLADRGHGRRTDFDARAGAAKGGVKKVKARDKFDPTSILIPRALGVNHPLGINGDAMAMKPITEDECIFCSHWPEKDRWALRDAIQILPMQDQDVVCDACFATFWQKCAADDPEPENQA